VGPDVRIRICQHRPDSQHAPGGQGVAGSKPAVPTRMCRSEGFRTSVRGLFLIFGSQTGSHRSDTDAAQSGSWPIQAQSIALRHSAKVRRVTGTARGRLLGMRQWATGGSTVTCHPNSADGRWACVRVLSRTRRGRCHPPVGGCVSRGCTDVSRGVTGSAASGRADAGRFPRPAKTIRLATGSLITPTDGPYPSSWAIRQAKAESRERSKQCRRSGR
jgi:hypothetical protein